MTRNHTKFYTKLKWLAEPFVTHTFKLY